MINEMQIRYLFNLTTLKLVKIKTFYNLCALQQVWANNLSNILLARKDTPTTFTEDSLAMFIILNHIYAHMHLDMYLTHHADTRIFVASYVIIAKNKTKLETTEMSRRKLNK